MGALCRRCNTPPTHELRQAVSDLWRGRRCQPASRHRPGAAVHAQPDGDAVWPVGGAAGDPRVGGDRGRVTNRIGCGSRLSPSQPGRPSASAGLDGACPHRRRHCAGVTGGVGHGAAGPPARRRERAHPAAAAGADWSGAVAEHPTDLAALWWQRAVFCTAVVCRSDLVRTVQPVVHCRNAVGHRRCTVGHSVRQAGVRGSGLGPHAGQSSDR